jgi:hypothetical protein
VLSIKSSWCRKPKRCSEQQSCALIMCSERSYGSCASLLAYRAWEANHSHQVQCPLWFFFTQCTATKMRDSFWESRGKTRISNLGSFCRRL